MSSIAGINTPFDFYADCQQKIPAASPPDVTSSRSQITTKIVNVAKSALARGGCEYNKEACSLSRARCTGLTVDERHLGPKKRLKFKNFIHLPRKVNLHGCRNTSSSSGSAQASTSSDYVNFEKPKTFPGSN